MARRELRLIVAAASLLGWLLAATGAAADGIPTPIPGTAAGPTGDVLQTIATNAGLTCQDDPAAPGLETACSNPATPGGELLTATFYTNPALVLQATAVTGKPPLSEKSRSFLIELAAPFCAGGTSAVQGFYEASIAAGPTGPGYTFEDAACRLEFRFNDAPETSFRAITAFSLLTGGAPLPSALASMPPVVVATPGPSPTAPSTAPAPAGVQAGPGAFASSIAPINRVSTDLAIVAQSALIALVLVLLMPFPAQLFNATLEKHADEVRGWFRWLRLPGGGGQFWRSPIGIGLFIAVSALLYALLDPGVGFTDTSVAEVVGIGLGIVLTAVAFELPSLVAHRRSGDTWRLHVLPGTILVGVVCVLISRITGFMPGYLYGLVLGWKFGTDLSAADQGRRTAEAGVLMLALALAAWLGLSALGSRDDLAAIALRTLLGAVVVGGLEGVVFGLLPLRFLHGEALYAWNRFAWAALFGLGIFAFAHILMNPQSGYLSDASRTPLLTIVALFLGFGALSIGFWGYFRNRPDRPALARDAGEDAPASGDGLRR